MRQTQNGFGKKQWKPGQHEGAGGLQPEDDDESGDDEGVDDDEDSEIGTLLESWISCRALQNESCFSWKARKSLRSYRGRSSSWQDLICTACNSMYEVKSKATPEKVEKTFKFNNISAGSLERFCHLNNSPKKPDQKMFKLILPRETH